MKIKDLYSECQELTRALSEFGRTLAFGVAAIGWFFRSAEFIFPTSILFSLFFIAFYFLFDILQYLWAAISLKKFTRSQEIEILRQKKDLNKVEVMKPASINKIPFTFFMLKFLCLLTSYIFLAWEFISRILIL